MTRTPNLLFIFSDQQRPDTLGCYGNRQVRTPHLDALAVAGQQFDRCYCTEPICTPSRAALLTGLWPHTTGVTVNDHPLPATARTLPELLPDGVFRCAYNGKWHLGDEIFAQHGFTDWTSVSDGYRDSYSQPEYLRQFSDYYHYLRGEGLEPEYEFFGAHTFRVTRTSRLPLEQTKPMFQARAAARFIRETGNRPFVCFVSFIEPHRPYFAPPELTPEPESVPVGPEFRRPPTEGSALVKHALAAQFRHRGIIDEENLNTEEGCRRLRARYLGMCSLIDRSVGEILAALDATGDRENTIIVYTSDHGDLVGDHGLWGKSCSYEASVRIPLIMQLPGMAPGRVEAPVSQIDLLPTLLDSLGVPIPGHLQGRSWLPVLRGDQSEDALGDVFFEFEGDDGLPKPSANRPIPDEWHEQIRGPWRSVVTADGWKLNLSPTDRCELFDLNSDPTESCNLFDLSAQRERVEDLSSRIREWQHRTGDPMVD